MADITYCLNTCCPFEDCERHTNNAPRNVPVSMAYLDGTCRRYIAFLLEEIENDRKTEESL